MSVTTTTVILAEEIEIGDTCYFRPGRGPIKVDKVSDGGYRIDVIAGGEGFQLDHEERIEKVVQG